MVPNQVNKTSSTAVRGHGSSGNVVLERSYLLCFWDDISLKELNVRDIASEDQYIAFVVEAEGPRARPCPNINNSEGDESYLSQVE